MKSLLSVITFTALVAFMGMVFLDNQVAAEDDVTIVTEDNELLDHIEGEDRT